MEERNTAAKEDEWRWVERVAEGDEVAFARLMERHQDRVVRLCQRFLGDRDEALDAAQEVFLKLYRKAGGLKARGAVYTWLYRVASNHCLNRLRRRKIVRFLPLSRRECADDAAETWDWEPTDEGPGPERDLESRLAWRRTRQAIAALPLTQRAVLVLARFEGLSYREIAQTLEITEGAVESRLFRAMRSLAKAQEQDA